jgi:hypothetical protein
MQIKNNNSTKLLILIHKRMRIGIQAGLELAADRMRGRYSQAISPPTSSPGEFPHIDSGQLVDNIAAHMKNVETVGRVGVYGRNTPRPFLGNRWVPDNIGGLHAHYLKENTGRLGIDDSFLEDRDDIAAEIFNKARVL